MIPQSSSEQTMNNEPFLEYNEAVIHYREYKPILLKKYRGCQACRSDYVDRLVIHHVTYKRYGHEKLSDLRLLCRDCHDEFHRHIKGNDPDLRQLTDLFIKRQGIWAAAYCLEPLCYA